MPLSVAISGLGALAAADLATGDLLAIVDISDTSEAPTGTTKKITADSILNGGVLAASFTTVKVGAGTAALPSIARATDTNTGIYWIGADNLGVACNGMNMLDISQSAFKIAQGIVQLTAATAVLVPGATSFRLTNAANTFTNITVLDAGHVTLDRGNLILTAGNLTFNASDPEITYVNTTEMFIKCGSSVNVMTFLPSASGGSVEFGGTLFKMKQWGGGSDANFPALKRSSTTLQVRLADDSGFAPLTAAAITGTTGAFSSTVTGGTYNGQTISSSASFTGTGAFASTLSSTRFIVSSALSVFSAGTVYLDSVAGLVFGGKTGSTADFAIRNNAGDTYLYGVTATQNVVFPGAVTMSSTLGVTGIIDCTAGIQAGAAQFFGFNGRSRFTSASNGVAMLSNEAQTDFSRLQFGGTTSSFPALKRAGTAIQVRLADDTAYANFNCGVIGITNTVQAAAAVSSTHKVTIDINGVTYYLLATNV